MNRLGLSRYALGICGAAALLSSCGGSQTPIGAPGAGQQTTTIVQHAAAGLSWMKPGASKGDLLYVSSLTNIVYVFTFPKGAKVGTLTGFDDPEGVCSDANGNVWIANPGAGDIVEYAHGGTSPIATLQDAGQQPLNCSVDPTRGNLAVGDADGNVAVYQHARGTPTYYSTRSARIAEAIFITYDGLGNLFFGHDTHNPGLLSQGSSVTRQYELKPHLHDRYRGLHWDGQYLTRWSGGIYRYDVSGKRGELVGIVHLNAVCCGLKEFWIQGSALITASENRVDVYKYPSGSPIHTITGLDVAWGVTVSAIPSSSPIDGRRAPRWGMTK